MMWRMKQPSMDGDMAIVGGGDMVESVGIGIHDEHTLV